MRRFRLRITASQSTTASPRSSSCSNTTSSPTRVPRSSSSRCSVKEGSTPRRPSSSQALRELCDQHGIVLIADEIQTGFARTGRMFAMEHYGVEPDLITMAKSLAGGFPLAAVVGKAQHHGRACAGRTRRHLCRLAGRLCSGARSARSDGKGKPACARQSGRRHRSRAAAQRCSAADLHRRCAWPRCDGGDGAGAQSRSRTRPMRISPRRWFSAAANGLVLLSCGLYGNVIRFLAPLTASDAIINEGLDIIERSLDEVLATSTPCGRGGAIDKASRTGTGTQSQRCRHHHLKGSAASVTGLWAAEPVQRPRSSRHRRCPVRPDRRSRSGAA